MNIVTTSPDEWRQTVKAWKQLGATHFNVVVGLRDRAADPLIGAGALSARVDRLERFKEVADEALRQ